VTRPYTGNRDGLSPVGARPGLKEFVKLCQDRWGFSNLGTFANRRMNNAAAKADPNNPKYLSVHATGRACDLGYKNRATAVQAWDWILQNAAALGVEEIHDYAFDPDGSGPMKPWGRGFRCSRGEGNKGVKIYNERENAGTPGGLWLHFELSPEMANNPAKLREAWNSIPPPGGVVKAGKKIIKPKPAKAVSAGRPDPAPVVVPVATPAPTGPAFPGDLDVGSKGEAVKMVQAKIGAKPDGDFGPKTGQAVSAWRVSNGMTAGTKVGPKVWAKMFG